MRPLVLIAEDFPEFRAKLQNVLEPLAVDCIVVPNGLRAIEVLRDRSHELDLLVTDMDMPVHNGWDVIEAARAHRGHKLPIVMQTGEAKYPYVQQKAASFGITLIDKKDIHELLVPAVERALNLSV